LLVIAFNYALPMAAWMRFRGMAWRPTLEVSGLLGFCGPAWVVMVIVMLFRLDLCTGRTGHQMGGLARHVERVA
jgi:hypothetical protein